MAGLSITLPTQASQTDINLQRWQELIADPALSRWEGRVETDRFGRIIVYSVSHVQHSMLQTDIALLLGRMVSRGQMFIACPLSTADGVKVVDVAWASRDRVRELGGRVCFTRAPEIVVEVLGSGNTEAEVSERIALCFDAGALEVWICGLEGTMRFFTSADGPPVAKSRLCPQFPSRIEVELEFD